jgi:hypothetical protein
MGQLRRALGRAGLAFLACYIVLFVAHCALDDAPPPWDEAYLLQYPTIVLVAWEREGALAAVRALFETRFMKPPLSMLGTLPPLLAFGTGSLSYRLDNLVVALAATIVLVRLLARFMPGTWAASFALGILVSPYALQFARIEMAELYLWAMLIVFLALVLGGDEFRSRGRSVAIGIAFAGGLLAKMSFPLLALGPGVWMLVRAVRGGVRDGDLRRRAENATLAAGAAVVAFLPFGAHNWHRMVRHARNQYTWVGEEYRLGDPFSLAYAARSARTLAAWVGPPWVALGAVLVLALIVRSLRARDDALARDLRSLPWVPLLAALLSNLGYYYFVHPVHEPRLALGALLPFQLLVALGLGALVGRSWAGRPALARLLLLPWLLVLLVNSYRPDGRPVLAWDLPLVSRVPEIVEPPAHVPDLRDAVLAPVAGATAPLTIAVAGDHRHLNSANLLLRAIERGLPIGVRQVAYLDPATPLPDRMRACGPVALWVVILPARDGNGTSWASRDAEPVRVLLDARDSTFRRLSSTTSDLGDGTRVLLYTAEPALPVSRARSGRGRRA